MSEYLRKNEFNKNKNNNDTDLADECKTIYDIPEDEETLTPSYYGYCEKSAEEEQDLYEGLKIIYGIPEDGTLTQSYYGADDEENEEYLYNEFLNNEFEENKEIFRLFLKLFICCIAGVILIPIIAISSVINGVAFAILFLITQTGECIRLLKDIKI